MRQTARIRAVPFGGAAASCVATDEATTSAFHGGVRWTRVGGQLRS